MDYLERDYTPEQIETARKMQEKLKEYAKIINKIEILSSAVKQTALGEHPEELEEIMGSLPLSAILGHGRGIPSHPLYEERFKLARFCGDDRPETEIKNEIMDSMSVEVLLLGMDARKIMREVGELGESLFN
jgi:hypothetical protein